MAASLPGETDPCVGFSLGGEVTLALFHDALGRFSEVLDALRAVHETEVDWMVARLEHGSVSATVQAVPLDDWAASKVQVLCETYLDAADSIQRGDIDFTIPLHRRMYQLAQLVDEAHPLAITANGGRVEIANPVSVERIDSPKQYVTFGTLRGRVETLSRHAKLNFRLYELTTGDSVICNMGPDSEEIMRDVWGYVADVTGAISRDIDTDRPQSMRNITDVARVDEGDKGGWRRARGALRSEVPAETLIDRLRDG